MFGRACIGYADCGADHGWHINYRGRYVTVAVWCRGTLIASKEDLSVQHGDICHSTEQCYPIVPSFLFLCLPSSLAVVPHLGGDQQKREKEGAGGGLLYKSVNLAVLSEQLPCRADV